ncbi:hypothetical protein SLA2020_262710 [Shorea laevis]
MPPKRNTIVNRSMNGTRNGKSNARRKEAHWEEKSPLPQQRQDEPRSDAIVGSGNLVGNRHDKCSLTQAAN